MRIPSSWNLFRLRDITYESRTRAIDENAMGLSVFGVNNQTGLDTNSRYFADKLDRYKIVKPGMFAYNPMRLNIGSIGYCDETLGQGLVSPDYVVFGCKENMLNSKYFSYYIQDHRWKKWVQNAGAGSVRVRIYYKDISVYPITLPSLLEQRKIAEILSTWDEAIYLTEQLVSANKSFKKGLMQQLLSGSKRFPEFKGVNTSWKEFLLQDIVQIIMGQSPMSDNYNNKNNGLPLIQGNADIKNRKTSPRFFTSQITKKCCVGDLILSVRAPVGEVAKSLHNACVGRGVCAIRAYNVDSEFLFQSLISAEDKWSRVAQGSTFTAINSDDIKNFSIFMPTNKSEQKKIGNALKLFDDELDLLAKKLNALRQQKRGLMQKLLTGQIRVKV